jgi:hypothetical protein
MTALESQHQGPIKLSSFSPSHRRVCSRVSICAWVTHAIHFYRLVAVFAKYPATSARSGHRMSPSGLLSRVVYRGEYSIVVGDRRGLCDSGQIKRFLFARYKIRKMGLWGTCRRTWALCREDLVCIQLHELCIWKITMQRTALVRDPRPDLLLMICYWSIVDYVDLSN